MKALISSTLLAAGLAFGAAPFGFPAVAAAAPDDGNWDIEAYDDCMRKTIRDADLCCIESGGIPGADKETGCHAPPAQAATVQGVPPRRLPPGFTDSLPTASQVPDVLMPAG